MSILHLFKYIFSSDYRYEIRKEKSEKKLRKRMAEHPENFKEDEYYIHEYIRNDKGDVVMALGRLKGDWPPEVKQKAEEFAIHLRETCPN